MTNIITILNSTLLFHLHINLLTDEKSRKINNKKICFLNITSFINKNFFFSYLMTAIQHIDIMTSAFFFTGFLEPKLQTDRKGATIHCCFASLTIKQLMLILSTV